MGSQIVIVSTGSEITNGKSLDTNSGWLANELTGLGFSVRKFVALPDDPVLIEKTLQNLVDDPELNWIIMTGGLGPTADDYTVDVVLSLTKDSAINIEKAKQKLLAIYKKRGVAYEEILPSVLRQTRVPSESIVLDNKVGIAPGFIVTFSNETKLVCMPGVPPEMKEMFQKRLLPRMMESSGKKFLHRGERFIWNIGESLYQEDFINKHPLLQKGNIEWGVTAKRGYIKVTFFSSQEEDNRTILNDLDEKYKDQISGDAHSDLHDLLLEKGKTLAIAESCTGGWVSKMLTDRPGSSKYFIGSLVTYHNLAKENLLFVPNVTLSTKGAVSEETAKEMLMGLEKHFDVDYSLSITGIAGPDGGSDEKPVGTVFIGIKRKGSSPRILKYFFPGNREMIRESTANNALFQLYKEVMKA